MAITNRLDVKSVNAVKVSGTQHNQPLDSVQLCKSKLWNFQHLKDFLFILDSCEEGTEEAEEWRKPDKEEVKKVQKRVRQIEK